MEVNSEIEFFDDSPVKKKRRKKNVKRPKSCIIHLDQTADNSTLSGFTESSWTVTFYSMLFEKFLWTTFAFISVKLYSKLLKIFKAYFINFVITHFVSPHLNLAFLEFEIFPIFKLKSDQ